MDPSLEPDQDTTSSMSLDHDLDGIAETTLVDSDGDGLVDTIIEEDPWTGATAVAVDTDGDGVIDTVAIDDDGDGLIDEAVVDDDGSMQADPVLDDGPFLDESGVSATLPDSDEGVHGEPRADIEYHQVQPGPVDCLPTSVAMVLSEVTGDVVPADDLVALANDSGFMTDQGMAAEDALSLLEHYGLDAELTSGTVDDMRAALAAGEPVIVGLDSADLYQGGGGPFDPGLEAGHAVVVTGIDDGPPGLVYINDPGFPDGAGVEIPLELFEDAWEDADNTLIEVTLPESAVDTAAGEVDAIDTGQATTAESADETGIPGMPDISSIRRLFLVPLTFIV